jgi:oxygen-independent coproporphyrinogen-3 oxidase
VPNPESRILNPGAPRFTALPPLSLYIHLPWCVRKCPYCDFNSHEARGELPEGDYVAALTADLDHALPSIWGRKIYTIFFGGGTPSLFSPQSIEAILSAVRARVPLMPESEITLEANPGTVEAEKFRGFRAAGVNRLSLGVQSFNPRLLKAIGRIHDDVEARRAVEIAQAHFDNVNLDLMYALPGQTPAEGAADLAQAVAYGVPHVSAYHLTLEPNTYFHRYPPQLPDDDAAADMQLAAEAALSAAGYVNYETSAFAKPGAQCKHNLNYWTFGDYVGIGAGAHAKLSFPDRVVREARWRSPREYLDKARAGEPIQTQVSVNPKELPGEFMMNALRLAAGFPLALFEERTGLPRTTVLAPLDEAARKGLLVRDHERVTPTERGRRFLNELLQLFLPA